MDILEQIKALFRLLNHPLNRRNKVSTIGRILWWKINQLFFRLPAVITLAGSEMKCICFPGSSYGGLVVYCNLPEYPEMKYLQRILKSNSVFLDVGANIGVYTLLAAAKIKKGKIYSFEPNLDVLNILYQNIRLNRLEDKVMVTEKVATDRAVNESFVIDNISEYSHISFSGATKSQLLPAVILDDFCRRRKINFIDVIKIDVEGAELKVLSGLKDYLKSGKVGTLILELNNFNSFYGNDSNYIINLLKGFGYKIYKVDNNVKLRQVLSVDKDQTINVVAILKGSIND